MTPGDYGWMALEPFVVGPYHSELSSGNYIDLMHPDPRTITLDDVSYGLSNICRFTGQTGPTFYSVAEHACLVAHRIGELGGTARQCLSGLHHDDAEALMGDFSRPMKKLLAGAVAPIEKRVLVAALEAQGITDMVDMDDPIVKDADNWALQREAFQLMPSSGEGWAPWVHPGGKPPWTLGTMSPAEARKFWLAINRQTAHAVEREALNV